ncbi:hypothetical protein D9613_010898 [Agrocybe pediades]|uniref:Uncharacterized protein n=1 Tax=Agrocybe pediades TaxID=84607 RepID=A0A8H4VMD5_9AGAR|nr:hypothetical protein D9613_010898 [Agrocybe pediades]
MNSSSVESSPSSHTSTRLSNGASIKCTTLQNARTQDVFQSMVEGRKSWKTLRGGEVIWHPELETAPVSFGGVAAPPSSHFHGTDTPVSVANRAVTTATVPKEGRMLACSQDGNFTKGSYVSASLAMVQKLPDGHCFLQFDIQCHPSPKFRVSRMDLDFILRAKYPNSSPTIRVLAP